ncbi:nitrilase-related carbon-nitrogen hydrolase [Sciscionella marina]|uniref:nitrilase-related carbon-nitrogen hydrolase n=1 Tax=Sciscionella marina TaxID=508770 RepID=UPI0003672FCF|nr:nitrilase-related carbon-nitrogen hydrolase [Sciscionella marina]
MDFRARRIVLALAALAASALLWYLGTGFAPIAALTWLAPLPVLLLAPAERAVPVFGIAFLASMIGSTNSWGFYTRSYDVPLPMGLLISASFAVTFALAVLVFRALVLRGKAMFAAFAAPALWTGAVYLISLNPFGIVGTLATTQAGSPVLLQIASVTGAWGTDFLVVFASAALAALCAPGVAKGARLRTGVVAVLVFGLVLGFGALRLSGTGPFAKPDGQRQRIALIVHNHAGWGIDVASAEGRALIRDYTAEIAALPAGVRTAVLPEGAFGSTEANRGALTGPLAGVARAKGVSVVVGLAHKNPTYQLAVVVAPDGTTRDYRKQHDAVGAPGHSLTFVPASRTGVAICADLDHPNPSGKYAGAGARLLAVPASDEGENGWQHSRNGVLRGVENGFAIAWSGRASRLLAADGYGRVRTDTVTGGAGALRRVVTEVPEGPGATPYTALGDWFAWLCLAVTAGAVLGSVTRRTR